MDCMQSEHPDDGACLLGALQEVPLTEILQSMHLGSHTAMVRVGHGWGAGVLFFKHGELYRCELARLGGMEALTQLLLRKEGEFALIQRPFPEPHRNISIPTPTLLAQIAGALPPAAHTSAG